MIWIHSLTSFDMFKMYVLIIIVNDELTNSYSGSDLAANTVIAIEHLSC